jgi:hypothetical protein
MVWWGEAPQTPSSRRFIEAKNTETGEVLGWGGKKQSKGKLKETAMREGEKSE